MLNDLNQSLVPALYPILKTSYGLDFAQIGMITLAFQLTASMLQPVVGMVTDRHPQPFSLPVAMSCSLIGLLLLSVASCYPMILLVGGVGRDWLIGVPSRSVSGARMASGGRYGFAQSLFQLGGSTGSAIGPLLAAFIVSAARPRQHRVVLAGRTAGDGAADLCRKLVNRHPSMAARRGRRSAPAAATSPVPRATVIMAMSVILILLFSKNVYTASLSSYYTFYLIEKFHVTVQTPSCICSCFWAPWRSEPSPADRSATGLAANRSSGSPSWARCRSLDAALCEPDVDRRAERHIGLILASAFSAIIVYAQELMPGRVGMVAG